MTRRICDGCGDRIWLVAYGPTMDDTTPIQVMVYAAQGNLSDLVFHRRCARTYSRAMGWIAPPEDSP